MEESTTKYMVEFTVPGYFDEEIEQLLDRQKSMLTDYFYEGKIFSFTISQDITKMWMVMIADSESELVSLIDSLPISKFCDYDYRELMLHNTVQFIPEHSLN